MVMPTSSHASRRIAAIQTDAPGAPGDLLVAEGSGPLCRGCCRPVWSPDGSRLAVEREGSVVLVSLSGELSVVAPALPVDLGNRAFLFDATGAWLAVAQRDGVLVVPVPPQRGEARHFPLPVSARPEHIVWSAQGSTFALAAHDEIGTPVAMWMDARSGPIRVVSGGEVLAVPDDETLWLRQAHDGYPDAAAVEHKIDGAVSTLHECEPGRFIFAALSRTRQLVLGSFGEDEGDAADFRIASPGQSETRPLFSGRRGVSQLTFSADGSMLAYLLREDRWALQLMAMNEGIEMRQPLLASRAGADADEESDAYELSEPALAVVPAWNTGAAS